MKKTFILLAAVSMLAACTEVPTGSRGIVNSYGAVQGEAISEGLVWYNPLTSKVDTLSIQTLKWASVTETYTKDVQKAQISFALNYNLRPEHVIKMYRQVGSDWAEALIPQIVQTAIKDVVGQSEAVKDVINNRPAVQAAIVARIVKSCAKLGINVTGFELTDVSFSEAFEEAVEAKQVAVENANAAKNKTVEVEENAKQRVIAANADAEAMKIKTAALSGNAKLVEYEAVQRWDGKLPNNMYAGAALPFIGVGK